METVTFDEKRQEAIIRAKRNRIQGPFSPIGPVTNKHRKRNMAPDIFDLLDRVSRGAFSVFNVMKFNRSEETNLTQYVTDETMTKTDREVLSRRTRELKNAGIIRAARKPVSSLDGSVNYSFPRGTFIINPHLLLCQNMAEAVHIWDHCKEEK